MNLFVLSDLHPDNRHVGWSVGYTFKESIARACNATLMYPVRNQGGKFLARYQQRLLKSWYHKLDTLPQLGQAPNVLLVVGLWPEFLLSMHTLGPLLKQFDVRIGYILDGFNPDHLDRTVAPYLDHLFVMNAELVDVIRCQHGINTSFLPLATDTFSASLTDTPRWIDIISYGRGNQAVHAALQAHFNQTESKRVYFHSTFSGPQVYDQAEHITLMQKLLSGSKINLCFEASDVPRFKGSSPLLYRWFEAWASGCTIVGKKPFGQEVAPLMDWENSTIELPDTPSDWIPFLNAILDDEATLAANSRRNYREALLRHDWCYRFRDIFATVGLSMPETLSERIALLRGRANEVGVPQRVSV